MPEVREQEPYGAALRIRRTDKRQQIGERFVFVISFVFRFFFVGFGRRLLRRRLRLPLAFPFEPLYVSPSTALPF
jgi:hypothetical protein